jgi:heterodisulfide reductase subunit A-like polyferredoxin
MLDLEMDGNGFFTANNEELDPVLSFVPGIYLAGAGLGPKDIPETVAQASGAALKFYPCFNVKGDCMSKIGVFVCHCGHNIASAVDVRQWWIRFSNTTTLCLLSIINICAPTRVSY